MRREGSGEAEEAEQKLWACDRHYKVRGASGVVSQCEAVGLNILGRVVGGELFEGRELLHPCESCAMAFKLFNVGIDSQKGPKTWIG